MSGKESGDGKRLERTDQDDPGQADNGGTGEARG